VLKLLDPGATVTAVERVRRARLTGVTNVLSHGSVLVIGLVSVPLSLSYLGTERYGIWLTLNSLMMWLALTDMGWGGNALINALAGAHGGDDLESARELVSTAFFGLCAIALVMAVLFIAIIQHVPLAGVFNASGAVPPAELRTAVVFVFLAFAVSFPAGVVQALCHGFQRGYVANVWNTIGSLLGLAALAAVTRIGGDLPRFVLALWGVRAALAVIALIGAFAWLAPALAPSLRCISRAALIRLSSLGVRYLVAQLAGLGIFQSQLLIVAHQVGPSEVGTFNLSQRILTLPCNLAQLLASPLLPAYGEARARADWDWIGTASRRSLVTSAAIGFGLTLPLAFGVRWLVEAWIGQELVPTPGLVVALSSYALLASLAVPLSVLLFGLEAVGGQARIALVTAAIIIVAGVWMAGRWGLAGLGCAMAIAFSVNLLGQIIQVRSVVPRLRNR
jgi:O-antigen/teichoic acid export membrane protein